MTMVKALRARASVALCLVLLGGLGAACKGAGKETSSSGSNEIAVVKGAPVTLSFEQPYKLVATGSSGEGTFFATKAADKPPLKLEGSFHGFVKGTKIKLGTEEGTIGDGAFWSTQIDLKTAVLKQSLEDLKGPIDVELEVSVTPPGAPTATAKLPKQDIKESLRFALQKARDGGVTFGADDAASGKPRGVAVVAGYSDLDFVGSAKNLREIDWVVIAENQVEPRTTKSCGFKEGPSTLKVFDAIATAYDRRTGARVAEEVIKASEQCPMFAMVSKQDNTVKNTVDAKSVVAWTRTALAKGPSAPDQGAQRGSAAPSTANQISR